MMGKSRLIFPTGATGYVGGRLLKALEAEDFARAAAREETKASVAT